MKKDKENTSKETAKVVATIMVPLVSLGVMCLSIGVYLMNNVFVGIK